MTGVPAWRDGSQRRDVVQPAHEDGLHGDIERTRQRGHPRRGGPCGSIGYPDAVMVRTTAPGKTSATGPDFALLGRIGAYTMHSRHSAIETTRAARAAAWARFEDEVDPQRLLDPAERAVRASAARRAHMLKLSLKSRRVRQERAARGS